VVWLLYIAQAHLAEQVQLQPMQAALEALDGTALAVVLAVVL
jgi:hypothetical protein